MTIRASVKLISPNASDDALAADLQPEVLAEHMGTLDLFTVDTVRNGRRYMAENDVVTALVVASTLDCPGLEEALEGSAWWRTGDEVLMVYPHSGVFLRLVHKDNRQAEIEYEVRNAQGGPL